jgi:hypothetical protein
MTTRPNRRITLKNVNHPESARSVDKAPYDAMRSALLKVLPNKAPGLTVNEIQERVIALLPEHLFPGGAKAGWWVKAVQLDLEAKRLIVRERVSPIRLHKA